ncbi:hypothetical protein GCM10010439_00750 [Actinocorallia aurantiaca]|uniref:Uncharacterized protein n=2 Tax=Actinocorallia aurantiaca TaxID=46204 RepID=A0ABP6G710_9ACTN
MGRAVMSRPVPGERRPRTVTAAAITMVLHGLVLGAGGALVTLMFGPGGPGMALLGVVLLGASGGLLASTWGLAIRAAWARRAGMSGAAAGIGVELLVLGALAGIALSTEGPSAESAAEFERLAWLAAITCTPLIMLGAAAIVLLRTRSVAAHLRAPNSSPRVGGGWRRVR